MRSTVRPILSFPTHSPDITNKLPPTFPKQVRVNQRKAECVTTAMFVSGRYGSGQGGRSRQWWERLVLNWKVASLLRSMAWLGEPKAAVAEYDSSLQQQRQEHQQQTRTPRWQAPPERQAAHCY